jgi:hypothetical protein
VREHHILNLGAGVQSTALYLLAREPDAKFRFDLAIFADSGEEPAAVYRHLEYLRSLGSPEIWVRSAGKLGDDLLFFPQLPHSYQLFTLPPAEGELARGLDALPARR